MNRKPRKGELNFELEKIIKTAIKNNKNFIDAIKSVELTVPRLSEKFRFMEFEINYNRSRMKTSVKDIPWITDGIEIIVFRKKINGSISIHRAGCTRFPAFIKEDNSLANLKTKRDINIYSFVDEKYSWDNFTILKPRKSLINKWKKS